MGRRLDVAWLGLQREADFRKKRAPRCSHSTVLIHGPPMDPQGAPKGPQENPRYSYIYRADKPGNPEPAPASQSHRFQLVSIEVE